MLMLMYSVPFPFVKDPKIQSKRDYMDYIYHKNIKNNNMLPLNGNEWYNQQASRAVNQALGRIIRHKNDYGIVIFTDFRFQNNNNKKNLSKWVKPYVKDTKNFGTLTRDILNNHFIITN